MIHQFRDKKQINQRKKIIKIIIIFIIFLILAFSGIMKSFSHLFNFIGKPAWEVKKTTSEDVNNLSYLTRTKSSLLKENEQLIQENSDLKILMVDYQILKDENEKLKELLGNINVKSDFILAGILVKPNQSPYDTLIIDVGQNNGVSVGSKVYVGGIVPVGEIKETYSKTSLVELYSNPNKITNGVIEGSNINIELIGRGGGNFEILVPIDLVIYNGTTITLPGIKSEIIAIAEEEISEPTDPIKKIILRSPINIQNQKWVEVKK